MPRFRPAFLLFAIGCAAPRTEAAPASAPASASVPVSAGTPPDLASDAVTGDCADRESAGPDSLRACLTRVEDSALACAAVGTWSVRQADGITRRAEWRRCGTQGGAFQGDSIAWPLHFLLLRSDTAPTSSLIFAYSNREEPGVAGIDTVVPVDFDRDGNDELFVQVQVYGTGAIFESCALALVDHRVQCWKGPEFPRPAEVLRAGESLMKGWTIQYGPPAGKLDRAQPLFAPGKSLWYVSPVYRDGDANCCPSSGATLWLEARPHAGRFDTGLVVRTHEDSTGTILSADTLRR